MDKDPDDLMDCTVTHHELDNPPVTRQKPDDVVDEPPVTHHKPDKVVDYPPVTHQKPDEVVNYCPETRQRPDDVVDDPPATCQRPDYVVDEPPVTHQKLDDDLDDSPATRQKPDDVVDNLPATRQRPDDVVDHPPVKRQNPDDDVDDPPASCQKPDDVVDDTPVTHQKPDYVVDPRNTIATSNQADEIQEDNVKPAEERRKCNIHATVGVAHVPTESSQRNTDSSVSNFTIGLFGNSVAVQFGCDNILTGENQVKETDCMTVSLQRKILDNHVSVINMIGLHDTNLNPSDQVIRQLVNENKIHAFIFVLSLSQLIDADKMGIEWLQRMFGDEVLSFVMILFTYEKEEESGNFIDDLKKNPVLEKLIEKCGQKYHICSKNMNNQAEMRGLMDRIRCLFIDNKEQCYTTEMYNKVLKDMQNNEYQSGLETDESSGLFRSQLLQTSSQSEKGAEQKLFAEQLMRKLYLEDKLKTADFLQLTGYSESHEFCTVERFAQTFLRKLLMMDYRAKCIKIKNNVQTHTQVTDNEDVDYAFNALFDVTTKSAGETDKLQSIHLMDAQMSVFYCADSFLKQLMVTKLSQCQFALPLLVPNPFTQKIEFPLWTFRQINKSWKVIDGKGQTFSKTQPVYKAKTPMVAFFRFGSVSSSKSQLMNSLINEKHNTFFHRNCPGSSRSRVLMDGVVEIAWYCPSGEETDKYPDCVAFCNLHGDAEENEKQLDILTQMASVNVVILPQLNRNDNSMTKIQNLLKDSKPLICLLTESDSALIEIRKGKKYKMGLKDRNQSDVLEEFIGAVNNGLSSSDSSSLFKLEDVADKSHITVDEKIDDDCTNGKDAAQKMMRLLKNKNLTEIKGSFLPCQGKLWHQWCQKNKELHQPTRGELQKGDNIEKNKSYKRSEMLQIREQQQASVLSEFIQIFIKKMNAQKENVTAYFLKWIGILLDDYTTETLSALHHEYDKKWSAVLDLKKKPDKSQQLATEQDELERISEKLQAATFGLEHILREIGQIYESCSTLKKNKKNLTDFRELPGVAADMMKSGFPLELMDGDAAHVPLIWVTAVLDELIKKLGDKRVFVLSVLGIQSSGKSTMLNAMFGLQFAVSAGRCTRGAFMQLVRVSEEMKDQLKFDYILVVDTEGLRALELAGRSTRNHDNEMATFVVGLGNMTLINIFGENTAEMHDILQIVVQAFMRMKKIKLNPSCMFVHQNVSDISAGEKNMEGRRRLQEKLDEMTRLAAKEEDCVSQFFSEVIAFDVQNDVKYFSQFWEGSPPMAPPNPNYSRNIQELKSTIISKASRSSSITLSQVKMRINDLWSALLNENFVFSFKNTMEIAVYRRLETKYSEWTWSLRSAMLSIEEKFYNRIANGNNEVQKNDLLSEMKTTKEEVEKSMKSYFDENRDKDILCQWRGRFETRIQDLHDDLVKETKRKLEEAIEQKKAKQKLGQKLTEYENMLFSRSKDLALSLKSEGTDEQVLKKEFDTMWSKWVTEMTKDIPPVKEIYFWEDVTQILSENNELTLVNERLNLPDFKQILIRGGYDDYIVLQKHQEHSAETESSEEAEESPKKSKSGIFKRLVNPAKTFITSFFQVNKNKSDNKTLNAEYHASVRQLIKKIIQETEKIMKNSPVRRQGYNDSYIQEITDCVKKSVEEHQSENQKYKLKKEFNIDLCLYVCDIAHEKFTKCHKEFRKTNDPRIYLEKQKTQYYNVFKNYCRGATTTAILIDFICSKLEPSIIEAVFNTTAISLAAQMRTDIRSLCENRPNLEKHILKSLAEIEDFEQYIQYIHDPKEHFKQFIKNEVDKYFIYQNEKILNLFKGNLELKGQIVSNAVQAVTVEVKNNGGDGNMWFTSFTTTLTDELKFTGNSCVDLKEIKDLDFLENHLSTSIKVMTTKLQNSFTSINDIDMEKCRKKPDEILIDNFCQCCWVQCPFCKAICTNTMKDHSGDHTVPFHRNIGLNGWYYRGTTNLGTEFCTTEVGSDRCFLNSLDDRIPWKDYRKAGPEYANWSITPDNSELPYWKWFVCRFQEDLETYYSKTFQGCGEIPDEWRKHKKEEAIESLDKYI